MFKLTITPLSNKITVSLGDNEIVFNYKLLYKNRLDEDTFAQYRLLNQYLNYKGDEFKHELFQRMKDAHTAIYNKINDENIEPIPIKEVHSIIDMFDGLDMFNYFKYVNQINIPPDVFEEYCPSRGSKVQTYIKDDFIELVGLIMIIKTIAGPIGYFSYILDSRLGKKKDNILFKFIRTHRIINTPPYVKIIGIIKGLLNQPMNKANEDVRVIDNGIAKDDAHMYYCAVVTFQRLTVAIPDDPYNSIVNRIYTYTKNKLTPTGGVSNSIRDKKPMLGGDGDDQNKESMAEAYRFVTDLTIGEKAVEEWAVSSVDMVLHNTPERLKQYVTKDTLDIGIKAVKQLTGNDISNEQLSILALVKIADPRALAYLSMKVTNLMAVTYSILYNLGFVDIATILVSKYSAEKDEDLLTLSGSVNKSRITTEQKERLKELYPFEKIVNRTQLLNLAEYKINMICSNIFNYDWIPTVPNNYRQSADIVPANIKIQLANLIIKLEEIELEYIKRNTQ